jgi:hypothetical protein
MGAVARVLRGARDADIKLGRWLGGVTVCVCRPGRCW